MTPLPTIDPPIALPVCRWRGPQLASGNYACASGKILVGPGGIPAAACAKCALADHAPARQPVRRPVAPAESPLTTCTHLGEPTGEMVTCQTCGGSVKLKVMTCGVHGRCTVGKKAGDLACCRGCPDHKPAAVAAPATTIIDHGAHGLGDGLLGLCAVAGFKADHPSIRVTYRPGASAVPFIALFHGYDSLESSRSKSHDARLPDAAQLNVGYNEEFRTRFVKPRWERYRENAGASRCVIPGLRDEAGLRSAAADLAGRVVLAPFSTEPAREWSVQHCLHLSRLLRVAGYTVAVTHTDGRKLTPFRAEEKWVGLSAERLTGALLSAVAVIGPDSGPAHLAGILGTPTVVLGGITPVDRIFGFYPRVACIQGALDCTGCCLQWPLDSRCRTSCAAIQTVRPDDVLAAVRKAVAG